MVRVSEQADNWTVLASQTLSPLRRTEPAVTMNALAYTPAGSRSTARISAAAARAALVRKAPTARDAVAFANNATTGPFAPMVRVTRNVVGQKDFNKFRGKAISVHSQVRARRSAVPGSARPRCSLAPMRTQRARRLPL